MVRPWRVIGSGWTRGSLMVGSVRSSSTGISCARASRRSNSRVGFRPPDSSLDSVLTDTPLACESCASVVWCCSRTDRSRGPTLASVASISSPMGPFAASARRVVKPTSRMHAAGMPAVDDSYDVVVIGGGAAGLAGAVGLLRSRRTVLLVDAGHPRNASAGHVHNFLTRDQTPPEVLYAAGRTEVRAYGGHILHGHIDSFDRDGDLFRIQVQDEEVTARRVLIATGARDDLPDIAGLAERWG